MLVVLYDDTGCAAWSPFGGRVDMPTRQRLADDGLTYSQWHTTALCSPTRSTFLTGRNHHLNGFAQIAEGAQGFPGYSSHTFEADGPTRKQTQYDEMTGHRGIWPQGWKAVTEHGPISGGGNFENDHWQLFHTDEDRSEAHDVADQHPDKVQELKQRLAGTSTTPGPPRSPSSSPRAPTTSRSSSSPRSTSPVKARA